MTQEKKEKLIRTYRIYNVVDWIIAIAIIATPFVFIIIDIVQSGGRIDEAGTFTSFDAFMNAIANLPPLIIVPLFIVFSMYTIFCFILYVKVWPIEEIRNTSTYWFDWVLSIGLTAYELFIFYVILFG